MKGLDQALHARVLRVWRRLARDAQGMPIPRLRRLHDRAQELAPLVSEVRAAAEGRLAQPAMGPESLQTPHGTDWVWRPEVWSRPLATPGVAAPRSGTPLGEAVAVFHDCARPELALRQLRNAEASDRAPFGLRMEVFGFDGSFLSLVLDLPEAAISGLGGGHVIRLDTVVVPEVPLRIFARLNIRHGPNTAQMVHDLPSEGPEAAVEFDLAYAGLNDKRIEHGWLDLIVEPTPMTLVTLRDVTLSRRPRAAL